MAESFWKIPEVKALGVPLQVLKEQAEKLTEQSDGLLRGEVLTFDHGEEIYTVLSIRVPNLNNYKIEIITYRQPLRMFPGRIDFHLTSKTEEVRSFEQFVESLKNYLSSQDMMNILGTLLAQAQV